VTSGGARRLLVIHPGALGDLVQALPAFAALRAAFGPETALLVGASHAAFVADLGLFGRLLTFDDAVAYHGAAGGRLRVLARAARDARAFRPAACAVFKAAPVYAALARASGARVRVGLTHGRLAAPLLTTAVPLTAHSHWESRYAAVAAALGAAALPDAAAAWPATAAGAARGAEDHAGVVIGIAPGGARNVKADLPQKRWPAARFAEVAARLAGRRRSPGSCCSADRATAPRPTPCGPRSRPGCRWRTVSGARPSPAPATTSRDCRSS
jgi:ADP-heptose:LPS heptosyltransferase